MKWTKETPSVEGYYWYRTEIGPEPSIVHVNRFPGYPLVVSHFGIVEDQELRGYAGEWYGPLQPPK